MTQINKDKGIRNRIKYPKSVYQIKRILWLKFFKMCISSFIFPKFIFQNLNTCNSVKYGFTYSNLSEKLSKS